MTVFSASQKEPLHGHNYLVSVDIELLEAYPVIPFSDLRKPIVFLCDEWHERVLLAANCPHFKWIDERSGRFELCQKQYQIPRDEVVLIEKENVTCENLCTEFRSRLIDRLKEVKVSGVGNLRVTIRESAGQGASLGGPSGL